MRRTSAREMLVNAGVVDPTLTITLRRLKGISGLHYASSYPGRKPTHALEPRPDGTYTVTQLFAHRALFACIPRPVEDDWRLGFDRPGRHTPGIARALYQVTNVHKLLKEFMRGAPR